MQGDWSLRNWLLEGLPSFLLPSNQRLTRRGITASSNNDFQDMQFFSLVNTLSQDYIQKPRCRDFGGAWKTALQSAIAVLPWQNFRETCRRQTSDKKKIQQVNSHCPHSHVGVHNSIKVPLSLSYSYSIYLLLEDLVIEANSLCFPAALAWSSAVMPPLENLPSKLLPTQLDKVEDFSLEKEGFSEEEKVEAVDISQVQRLKLVGQDKVVVEPKTGFQFPAVLCPDPLSSQLAEAGKQVLTGVGLRSLTVMKLKSIKIYAFALYIRPDIVKAQLGEKYGAVSSEDLKHDPQFYEDILSHDLGMTVRLMVHYKSLKMAMVRSAFDTSLRNRLKKIKGMEDDEGLEAFNSYFSQNLLLPRGTIIDFRWLPGGHLRTEIDGELLGTIRSRDFCRAFFDLYIGDPPVSCKAKEEMGEKLSQILQAS